MAAVAADDNNQGSAVAAFLRAQLRWIGYTSSNTAEALESHTDCAWSSEGMRLSVEPRKQALLFEGGEEVVVEQAASGDIEVRLVCDT